MRQPALPPGEADGLTRRKHEFSTFLQEWVAAWEGLTPFAVSRGREDRFAAAGHALAVVGRLIQGLGTFDPRLYLVPALDHLTALAAELGFDEPPRRAARLLALAAGGCPAPGLAEALVQTDAVPRFRPAFGWLRHYRDRLLWPPPRLELPCGVCLLGPNAGAACDPDATSGNRRVDTAFFGWRTPRGLPPSGRDPGLVARAAAEEFRRFNDAVTLFTQILVEDPRYHLCAFDALIEAAAGQYHEARLLAARHRVRPPREWVFGTRGEFEDSMRSLSTWGVEARAGILAGCQTPAAAVEPCAATNPCEARPVAADADLTPWCRGRLRCSPDFGRVVAGGKEYRFTTSQRVLIEYMVRQAHAGRRRFSGEELFRNSESLAKSRQVRELFRSNGKNNPAWKRLIVPDEEGRGWYRLELG